MTSGCSEWPGPRGLHPCQSRTSPIVRPQMITTNRTRQKRRLEPARPQVAGGQRGFPANHSRRDGARGPLLPEQIESQANVPWDLATTPGAAARTSASCSTCWWYRGYVTVTAHGQRLRPQKKQWGLMEHQLGRRVHESPAERPRAGAAGGGRRCRRSARPRLRDVKHYSPPPVPRSGWALAALEQDGVIQQVRLADGDGERPGPVVSPPRPAAHAGAYLRREAWQPQTVLLSPSTTSSPTATALNCSGDFYYRIGSMPLA